MGDAPAFADVVAPLVDLGRRLRASSLPVGTGRIVTFIRAVGAVGLARDDVYWAARASLISRPEDVGRFDAAFDAWLREIGSREGVVPIHRDSPSTDEARPPGMTVADAENDRSPRAENPENERIDRVATRTSAASGVEVLRRKSFGGLSDEERGRVADMIRQLSVRAPLRRSRRTRPAANGSALDVRRTFRRSLRTSGEPFERARRERRIQRRPVVLVLDISGSMAPYSRALLQFAYAAMGAGGRIEVFCFGTRLTRITGVLRTGEPDRAFAAAGRLVDDWEGGTRIGESLKALLDGWSQRAALRGSVVVVCSDGLERGDPDMLGSQMQRLHRLAYRIVWANPLKGAPGYEPLARGMAAALPSVDRFVAGHNVQTLGELARAVGD